MLSSATDVALRDGWAAGPCAAIACDAPVEANGLACARHWRMLPRFTQRSLDEARRTGAARIGGRWRSIDWWEQRAAREINCAVINREAQLTGRITS